MVCRSEPLACAIPSTPRTVSSAFASKTFSVTPVTERSTAPVAASMFSRNACENAGSIPFMLKMIITPKITASVVRKVRSLRPLR